MGTSGLRASQQLQVSLSRRLEQNKRNWIQRYQINEREGHIERATAPQGLDLTNEQFWLVQNRYRDEVTRSANYVLDCLTSRGAIVDCGSGVGHLIEILVHGASQGRPVLGIDFAYPAINKSREAYRQKAQE